MFTSRPVVRNLNYIRLERGYPLVRDRSQGSCDGIGRAGIGTRSGNRKVARPGRMCRPKLVVS